MKIVDYKKLAKLPADALFATINKMNELGEVLVLGQYPDGRRFIYSPLADVSSAGNKEIDFDDNAFNRTGSFVVFEKAEIERMCEKFMGIVAPQELVPTARLSPPNTCATPLYSSDPNRVPLVPVYRQESARNFVARELVPPSDVQLTDGVIVSTAPLALGAHFSLLGISETRSLLESYVYDTTDAIDPALALKAIYVRVEMLGKQDEVYRLSTLDLATAQASIASQGGYRELAINFHQAITIGLDTETIEGTTSKILTDFVTIFFTVSGTVNLELGDTRFFAQRIESLSTDDGLIRFSVVGYDLDAGRVNYNRRRRAA